MIRVFLGYDPRETIAYHVAAHSILRHASIPVSVTPVKLNQLPITARSSGSTEFAFSRFIVPWLCQYEGWAIFADCDVLLRADIKELFDLAEPRYAVQVVKHDYTPRDSIKFLGALQQRYDKKNWSSVMLFNCELCTMLTPKLVNTLTGLQLHQFHWVDDDMIGDLPPEWNWLVDENGYPHKEGAKLVHYTRGGPWFREYANCDYGDEWRSERDAMLHADASAITRVA